MDPEFTTVSQSDAVFTKIFRNYFVAQERTKFDQRC